MVQTNTEARKTLRDYFELHVGIIGARALGLVSIKEAKRAIKKIEDDTLMKLVYKRR